MQNEKSAPVAAFCPKNASIFGDPVLLLQAVLFFCDIFIFIIIQKTLKTDAD